MTFDLHETTLPPPPEGYDTRRQLVVAVWTVVGDHDSVAREPPFSRAVIALPARVTLQQEILNPRSRLTDLALPVLPPYEFALYVLLVRRSRFGGEPSTRIGKRSISAAMGKGTRAGSGNYHHITNKLAALEIGGFIESGGTDRTGTEYAVRLPREVPSIRERLEVEAGSHATGQDHFADPALRRALFERDDWRCRYCGARVDGVNSTLDHIVPQHAGGASTPDNLATACLMCNSIKSGRTYEQAAPLLLERVARAARSDATQSPAWGGGSVSKEPDMPVSDR